MKIAVLSDSHGRNQTVRRALALIRDRGLSTVLHCGDIEDPGTIGLFAGLDAHFVYGNCDSDREGLDRAAREAGLHMHAPYGHLELAGRNVAFLHGDDGRLLRALLASGAYDYLFHGHTHVAADRVEGATRVINPGALYRANPRTLLVLDLATGGAESVVVDE